jgi:chlorite dismutase
MSRPDAPELPDVAEKGRDAAGNPISVDRRLYMQLLVFDGAADLAPLQAALAGSGFQAALYADLNNPRGAGLVTASTEPEFFASDLRSFLARPPFRDLALVPAYTMLGRSYAIGYESDLEHVLVRRPLQRLCNPAWPWAVWYPLRRRGSFERLPPAEQQAILREHGNIGALFTAADLGYDIRLACHGIDRADNDFVIGLIGSRLHPLSAMVQTMRKTRQTSEFLESLGPFFIGRASWQSPLPAEAPAP